jgi:hypothetical protein
MPYMRSTRSRLAPALQMGCLSLAACLGLCLSASASNAQTFAQSCTRQSAPVLRTSGLRLLRDGQPSFLVLVSYFDAMRASEAALDRDFAFLKSKGIDGIRIFPLWVYGTQKPDATLLDANGRIRSDERWAHFVSILQKASACGFVVDVTFDREQLAKTSEFTVAEFQAGIVEVVSRLHAEPRYPHVFIDLQNERGHPNAPAMQLTVAEVRRLRDAVKRADPSRLVMVSTQGGETESLSLAMLAELDVIAFHELQKTDWHNSTMSTVQALKVAGVPIYLQEMARAPDRGVRCARDTPEMNPFVEAMRKAKEAGAAAWTLHTGAAFRLDVEPFQAKILSCQREIDFLEALKVERN